MKHWMEIHGIASGVVRVEESTPYSGLLDIADATLHEAIVRDPLRPYEVRSCHDWQQGDEVEWEVVRNWTPPSVGALATYSIGSDRYGGSITAMTASGRRVTFVGENGFEMDATLRKSGRYIVVGSQHGTITVGYASNYSDPSF